MEESERTSHGEPRPRPRVGRGCLSVFVSVVFGIAAFIGYIVIVWSCEPPGLTEGCDSVINNAWAWFVLALGVAAIVLVNRLIWRTGTGVATNPDQQPARSAPPTPKTPPAKEQRMVALEKFVDDGRKIKIGQVLQSSDRIVKRRPERFRVAEDEDHNGS